MGTDYTKAMSALASAANGCRWNRGPKAIESLRKKLADAEAAAETEAAGGDIPPTARLRALARSRLDARVLTMCVEALVAAGHGDDARRLVALCERMEPEECSVASAVLDSLPRGGAGTAMSRVAEIAHDGTRSARIRLIALAWLISADLARSAHVPLLDIIGTAIDRRDWASAQMGMEALRHLLWRATAQGYGGSEWGKRALLSELEWPGRSDRGDGLDDDESPPRWPHAARVERAEGLDL